jgi:hypothetical protein
MRGGGGRQIGTSGHVEAAEVRKDGAKVEKKDGRKEGRRCWRESLPRAIGLGLPFQQTSAAICRSA